jgi:hypothetical protein
MDLGNILGYLIFTGTFVMALALIAFRRWPAVSRAALVFGLIAMVALSLIYIFGGTSPDRIA